MLWSRPHHAHLATQDVPRLGQLIKVEATQHLPHPGDALVSLGGPAQTLVRMGAHRAQLEDFERLAEVADAILPVKHRAAILQLDGDPHKWQQHGKEHRAEHAGDDVDESFEDGVDARSLPTLLQGEQPCLAQPFDEQSAGQLLVDVRDGPHDEPEVVAVDEALEEAGRQVVLGAEHDLVGSSAGRRCPETAAGVGVGGVDGADHPVEASQVLIHLGPDPVDGLGVGNQHDPAGENRPGEHTPVEKAPAEDRERRHRNPDEDGRPGDPIRDDEEDDEQRNRFKRDRGGDDAEDRPSADRVMQIVGIDDLRQGEPDGCDQGHSPPGDGQRRVLDRTRPEIERDDQGGCDQHGVPSCEEQLSL